MKHDLLFHLGGLFLQYFTKKQIWYKQPMLYFQPPEVDFGQAAICNKLK